MSLFFKMFLTLGVLGILLIGENIIITQKTFRLNDEKRSQIAIAVEKYSLCLRENKKNPVVCDSDRDRLQYLITQFEQERK